MPQSILVTGATGKLGRLIVRRLLELGEPVRAFTRRPEIAASLFGTRVEIATGDFAEAPSLARAFTSVDRVLLLSPISEHLARDQIAVIEAAERQGVERIVKISGSNWTIDPPGRSISGAEHAAVERRLAEGPVESVALRPNAWMQVSLPSHIAQIKAGKPLVAAYSGAKVGYIDARDIAEIAVHQLLVEDIRAGRLVLTGAEALSVADIAQIASRTVGHAVAVSNQIPAGSALPLSFEQRAVAEFQTLIGEGRAAEITDIVPRLLGHTPRTVEDFLAEHLEAVAA